jgi:hypothetical protein
LKKDSLISILKIFVLSLLVKILLAWWIPFTADEAYYWVWTQAPQWSYFDHPPFIAWLLEVSKFFNFDFHGVRLPAIVFCHLALIPWILILVQMQREKIINKFLWFALLSPMIGFGSIIVTPDLPLVFFWSWGIWFAIKYFNKPTNLNALWLGLICGLGFTSKYNMILLVVATLVFLILEKKFNKLLFKHLSISFIGFLVACFPVIYWNLDNNFLSFRFQLRHGFAGDFLNFETVGKYLLGQLVILTPIILWFSSKRPQNFTSKYIHFVSWFVMAFFLISSFKNNVEMNWTITALPGLMLLCALNPSAQKWMKLYNVFWTGLFLLLLINIAVPFDKNAKTKYNEVFYYQPLLELRDKYDHLYGGSYQIASYLWFYSKKPTYKLKDISRIDHFDFLPQAKPVSPVFYVVKEPHVDLPYWAVNEYHVKFEQAIGQHFELLRLERK